MDALVLNQEIHTQIWITPLTYQFTLLQIPDADILKCWADGVFALGIIDDVGVSTGDHTKDGARSVALICLDHGVSRVCICIFSKLL